MFADALLLRYGIGIKKAAYDVGLEEGLPDNFGNVFHGHLLVKNLLGKYYRNRTSFAKTMAARLLDFDF